ncbi:MAG: hypothetical protein U0168_02530 [Nannocystaceae bacterium]|jgi:type II secretory pathway component PulC
MRWRAPAWLAVAWACGEPTVPVDAAPQRATPPAAAAPTGAEAIACDGDRCTVAAALAASLRADPAALVGLGRLEPVERDGRALGLRVLALEPLPRRLGFADGDVIVSINGLAVQSPQSAPQLYLQLRAARRFTVVFERDGVRRTKRVDVV